MGKFEDDHFPPFSVLAVAQMDEIAKQSFSFEANVNNE